MVKKIKIFEQFENEEENSWWEEESPFDEKKTYLCIKEFKYEISLDSDFKMSYHMYRHSTFKPKIDSGEKKITFKNWEDKITFLSDFNFKSRNISSQKKYIKIEKYNNDIIEQIFLYGVNQLLTKIYQNLQEVTKTYQ